MPKPVFIVKPNPAQHKPGCPVCGGDNEPLYISSLESVYLEGVEDAPVCVCCVERYSPTLLAFLHLHGEALCGRSIVWWDRSLLRKIAPALGFKVRGGFEKGKRDEQRRLEAANP